MHGTRVFCMLLAGVMTVAGLGCASKKTRAQAVHHRELGRAHLGEGTPESALAELTKAVELNPKDALAVHYLGLAYWYKGRALGDSTLMVEAEQHIRRSIELKNDPEWRNNLCALYVDLARYDDAITECRQLLRETGYRTPERALNNIGKAYIDQGMYSEALDPLNRALRLQPQSCQVLWNKGKALKGLRRWDDALESLQRVTNICPDYPEPFLLMGQVLYFGKRDSKGATVALERVKRLDPLGPIGDEAKRLLREIPAP